MEIWVPPPVDEALQQQRQHESQQRLREVQEVERKQGYEAGFAQGVMEGKQSLSLEQDQLRSMQTALRERIQGLETELASQLVTLVSMLAKALVRREMQLKPERLLEIIRDAMKALSEEEQDCEVFVNPEDKVLLEPFGTPLQTDAQLSRGSFVVKTRYAKIDAQLEHRLAQILETALQSAS